MGRQYNFIIIITYIYGILNIFEKILRVHIYRNPIVFPEVLYGF